MVSVGRSDRVKILVNVLWDWLDLGAQLILNLEHFMLVVFGNKVDGETEMTEPAGTSDPVKVGVRAAREVEVDNDVHGHDIDTTCEEIGAHKASGLTIAEVVINSRKL